jgi:renalase
MPYTKHKPRVIVIGAGLTGLTAAHALEAAGASVTVLEKARGAGGRMSTRRQGDISFDHGAPSFTVRNAAFADAVAAWEAAGVLHAWHPRAAIIDDAEATPNDSGTDRVVAVPGMSSLCRHLAEQLEDCRFGWRVTEVHRETGQWTVDAISGEPAVDQRVSADVLIVTVPAPQAQALLGTHIQRLAALKIGMHPCWVLMARYDKPLLDGFDAAWVTAGPLCWVASEASKPARAQAHAWTMLASPAWTNRHLEAGAEQARDDLLRAAADLPGSTAPRALETQVHRWRFAQVDPTCRPGAFHEPEAQLLVTGDWCFGGGVEAAYLAGIDAGERIRRTP